MIYSSINGVKLGELSYEEMMRFSKELIFFKFMDNGRSGIESACREVIGIFIGHFEKKGFPVGDMRRCEQEEAANDLISRIINSFITRGTSEFEGILNGAWTNIAQYKPAK